MKITDLERAFLIAVMESDYNEGSGYLGRDAIDNQVWTFCPVDRFGLENGVAKTSGVVSSLVQKGAVGQGDYEASKDVTWITEAGFDALVATGYEPKG